MEIICNFHTYIFFSFNAWMEKDIFKYVVNYKSLSTIF